MGMIYVQSCDQYIARRIFLRVPNSISQDLKDLITDAFSYLPFYRELYLFAYPIDDYILWAGDILIP